MNLTTQLKHRLFAGVIYLVMAVGIKHALANPISRYHGLLRSDLVLRGTVVSVVEELVPASELAPSWTAGGTCRVSLIELTIDEVLHGWFDQPKLTFVVDQSRSSLSGRYSVDDEMVVSLNFRPDFRDGVYFSAGNRWRFVLNSTGKWVRQGGISEETELDVIRELLRPAEFDEITASSTNIVVATVIGARREKINSPDYSSSAYVWIISANIEQVLKGSVAPGRLTFKMFQSGTYWPSWAAPGPTVIGEGNRFCIFLKEVNGVFCSEGGINGFFLVGADGHLVRNGRLRTPFSIEKVRRIIEGEPSDD